MPNKMLIDASHPEETRVVVVRGNRIEEFDFESQDKKQLRGNIYLARVTRVEPSLQAAFIEYGGNRHGFLAFSEIHPDYYQIPVADREALLKAEAEDAWSEEDSDDQGFKPSNGRNRRRGSSRSHSNQSSNSTNAEAEQDNSLEVEAGTGVDAHSDDGNETTAPVETDVTNASTEVKADVVAADITEKTDTETSTEILSEAQADAPAIAEAKTDSSLPTDQPVETDSDAKVTSKAAAVDTDTISEPASAQGDGNGDSDDVVEIDTVGSDDALEEVPGRRRISRRQYKIQDVIKRRQILLIQVVKEERGNKGAALTTYLSLAGRYSVLMPNTARGGGISRKITNIQDRKRLKEIVTELEVPTGMGVILRTAGANRTKVEIKRDYEYLMRLWESVRTLTLQSIAPALVYEEGSLIKRAVRDLYNKDVDQILVSGEEAYREAKDFMRMLMPSQAKVVQPYRDPQPIFARNGIEQQLDKILQPQVTLKSGGYIIINQTEALVAIDVNSGRSTKEHSIEDTALQTNLEAAEEVARQLRLRDLAGLIVIDFIDMEESRNNRAVEKRVKECLKNDRARIQVGRISHFGLLEMSRQRIRSSVLESTMQLCPHCEGTGYLRSDSSVALLVVRAIEEYLLKETRHNISVRTPTFIALYLLNQKRQNLIELETRFGVAITIETDDKLGHQHYAIVKGEAVAQTVQPKSELVVITPVNDDELEDIVEVESEAEVAEESASTVAVAEDTSNGGPKKRRRKRRRRNGRDHGEGSNDTQSDNRAADVNNEDVPGEADEETSPEAVVVASDDSAASEVSENIADETASKESSTTEHKKRQRGKRGGKRSRPGSAEGSDEIAQSVDDTSDIQAIAETTVVEVVAETVSSIEPEAASETVVVTSEVAPITEPALSTEIDIVEAAPPAIEAIVAEEEKPKPRRRAPAKKAVDKEATAAKPVKKAATTKAAAKKPAAKKTAATPAVAEVESQATLPEADIAPAEKAIENTPAATVETIKAEAATVQADEAVTTAEKPAKPSRARRSQTPAEAPVEPVVSSSEPEATERKSGWWQRRSFF